MKSRKVKRYGNGARARKILLVAPRHPENFWAMQGTVDILGTKTLMPNAALATLMALTPPGVTVEYALCDENVGPIDFRPQCDLVAVTGATIHAARIRELCRAFRSQGLPVALGGTFATVEGESCRNLADHVFIGEAEYTWPKFLRQWVQGRAEAVYRQQEYVDLADSPAPDWSLLEIEDYVNINIQSSRGCPNRCDFCDVIQYGGRSYRHKTVDQIMTEVRNAHRVGARTVFFSDDNFLGNRAFTGKLLSRLKAWNVAQTRPLSFSTQATVQIADDEDLLKLFADCRFSALFLGVESVREKSLQEVHKTLNLKHDLHARIRRISRYGLVPFIGLIVGFDHDDPSVFNDLYRFMLSTYSPIAGISLLNAPKNTPLYKRLKKEGRITTQPFSGEWQLDSNVIPKQMSPKALNGHYWKLFRKLYEPARFEGRLEAWLKNIRYSNEAYTRKKTDPRQLLYGFRIFRHFMLKETPEVRKLFFRMMRKTWRMNPKLMRRYFSLITQYSHFYHFVNRKRTPV
jgi:radical SAM superfamily enzyme YgiQ (UPF0313 family)